MPEITEGKTTISVPNAPVRKKTIAFYNPNAAMQRHIAVALLQALGQKNLRMVEPLAGTGVRSARFLNELDPNQIKTILVNDANPNAIPYLKKNVTGEKVTVSKQEASVFLQQNGPYDYIDIDPYGSPNPFLDAACKKLTRKGILAVCATDTAALSGNAIRACLRKYYARPLHNEYKHEIGMRILIRKIQLIAAQYKLGLVPIYCHSTQHYMRVYLQVQGNVKDLFTNHQFVHHCFRCAKREVLRHNKPNECCEAPMSVGGPMWVGQLWDCELAQKVAQKAQEIDGEAGKLTAIIAKESKIDAVTHYTIPKMASVLQVEPPKTCKLIAELKDGAPSHFGRQGFRTTATYEEFKKAMQK